MIARDDAVAFALGAIPALGLAFADGGFNARPWSWATLGLACAVVAAALLYSGAPLGRRMLGWLAIVATLATWIALSTFWSRSTSLTVPESQRVLLYVVGVAAAVLLVRASAWRSLLLGVMAGLSAALVWGLVSYLVTRDRAPAQFEGFLLHAPMGYANAMAIAAVMAILIALGFVADGATFALRFGCGIVLVPLVSALTLTGSRAAWGALLLGVAVAVASSPRRRATVRAWALVLLPPAVAVVALWTTDLSDSALTGARAGRLGNVLLGVLVALTALSTVTALAAARGTRSADRVGAPGRVVRWLLVGGVVCAVVGALVVRTPDLSGDRPAYWRAALGEFAQHPLLGTGAGTYHQVWLERRAIASSVRDAHSIEIEGLSELGVIGGILVVLVLGVPLVWGFRARRRALVPVALGAYSGFAAHALVDWDWEMPAVTLAALFIATGIALAAQGDSGTVALSRPLRLGTAAAGLAAGLIALAGFVGSSALEEAQRALARGDAVRASRFAGKAERWQPWSVEPLLIEGRTALTLSRYDEARSAFSRAVERDPNDYRAWLALAVVSQGDERALAVLRARELNPRVVVP